MKVLVPHQKTLKVLLPKFVWAAVCGLIVRVFIFGWYKLMGKIWFPRFKPLPNNKYNEYRHYLNLCADYGSKGADVRLAMDKELEQRMQHFLSYLEEKLGPYQFSGHGTRSIGEGLATKGHQSFQIKLCNIKYRYWSLVLLPGLSYMLKRWDCPMFYDVKPELPEYKDDDVFTEINLNVWINKKPYNVVQHRRFR